MIRLAYSALFMALLPLVVLRMLLRSRRAPAYRKRIAERFGCFPAPGDPRPRIWIHAVSLGETLAARALIERLLRERDDHLLVITTTTPTGSAQLRQLFGERVFHVYAPWDTPGAVRRFLRRVQPRVLVLMETELWPNMLHYSRRAGCEVLLANARLSAKSAAGYARIRPLARQMLGSLSWLGAQSDDDARRFRELGMAEARIAVTGSIKFDIQLSASLEDEAAALRKNWQLAERPTVIVASTHEGEDEVALRAFAALRRKHPAALMLLAPRHPERFGDVGALCESAGWTVARRSAGEGLAGGVDASVDLLLIDTLGELFTLFGVADIAVIGGSFVGRGGHNPLEAAAWGMPVLCGPSMFNFADIALKLHTASALRYCADDKALAGAMLELFASDAERERAGAAARSVMCANRGALEAVYEALARLLGH